ncbi:ABC transporter permease [Microtetraspora niveoalba]|uniref:ABC transporter permease n=1 Tax=Microtetraspora niveoalba TaxID=46175 RepID=UPI00083198FE|nr:ABC transporter permease [Microtetraspora niveoalba]
MSVHVSWSREEDAARTGGAGLPVSRLRGRDVVRVGLHGLRARALRVALSVLGIAIGIAAMVAVVGISASSRAELERTLDRLGTGMLTVSPGDKLAGGQAELPTGSVGMIGRLTAVAQVSAAARLADVNVYRNDRIPAGESKGLSVRAARLNLLEVTKARLAQGTWLNPATARYPVTVLGAHAAELLGVPSPGMRVWLGGRWFAVAGILESAPLAPELDVSALIGEQIATTLGFEGHPTTIYVQVGSSDQVLDVRDLLAATANPEDPHEVKVSRPSEALAAQRAADMAFTGLLLGLGGVALLVGGVGVANTMIISVLERRGEIGLRRSLGATRGHIRVQFLVESQLLAGLGGLGGILLGTAVTAVYALAQGWPAVLPVWATGGALAATLIIGGIAGLYPAIRAARTPPTQALASL